MTCHHSGPDFSNGLGYLPGVSGKNNNNNKEN
jgi:hypothetical protein